MKEEGDNKNSLKKWIYYSLGILTPNKIETLLNFMSHFNSTYTNYF